MLARCKSTKKIQISKKMRKKVRKDTPHPLISIIPLLVLIVLIATVMKMLPDEALSGASQISMMIATAICVALSMSIYRTRWQLFEACIKQTIGDTFSLVTSTVVSGVLLNLIMGILYALFIKIPANPRQGK